MRDRQSAVARHLAGTGLLPGQGQTANGGGNYTGGRWFFTLNGLQYPTIPVTAGQGEIWRITNASGSATYDLQLWDPAQSRNILMQVLAIDGVSVSPTATMSMKDIATLTAAKMQPEACPGLTPGAGSPGVAEPLCVRRLHMMPSSRVEVWVAYRDQNDFLVAPPAGASAIFRTAGFNTGPGGDSWPPVTWATCSSTVPARAPGQRTCSRFRARERPCPTPCLWPPI